MFPASCDLDDGGPPGSAHKPTSCFQKFLLRKCCSDLLFRQSQDSRCQTGMSECPERWVRVWGGGARRCQPAPVEERGPAEPMGGRQNRTVMGASRTTETGGGGAPSHPTRRSVIPPTPGSVFQPGLIRLCHPLPPPPPRSPPFPSDGSTTCQSEPEPAPVWGWGGEGLSLQTGVVPACPSIYETGFYQTLLDRIPECVHCSGPGKEKSSRVLDPSGCP